MLKTCESFAIEYDAMFNERKTTAIKFGNNSMTECHLLLNVSRIKWTNEVKHLGSTVTVVYRHERLYDEKVTVHLCGKHVYRKLWVYSKSNLMLFIWILLLYFVWIPVVGLQF